MPSGQVVGTGVDTVIGGVAGRVGKVSIFILTKAGSIGASVDLFVAVATRETLGRFLAVAGGTVRL